MVNINRYISLLMCLLLSLLVGCNVEENKKNIIEKQQLTDREEEIVGLIDDKQKLNVYKYMLNDNEIESYKIWVETYKNGELIDDTGAVIGGVDFNDKESINSTLIVLQQEDGFKVSLSNNVAATVFKLTLKELPNNLEEYNQATSSIDKTEFIEGEEIILNQIFLDKSSTENNLFVLSDDYYKNNPDKFKELDYLYVLKLKFSKESVLDMSE